MLQKENNALILHLYIQPKASRDQFVGKHGDEFKVAITAPPTDGKANSHLIAFLSKQFKVPKKQISLEKGESSRHKQIKIINPKHIPEILADFIS